MKLIKTLSCLLIISLTFASYAEAKGRSFGGGFRSQRMAPAPQRAAPQQATQAPQTTQAKSTFGSFGTKPTAAGATPTTAPQNAQPLNMSKDLNTNSAQGNALKTNEARTASGAAAGGTAGASNSGWFGSGNAAQKTAPMQSAAQSGGMQQRGGGFINNAMWFMLGSSLASNHNSAANQHSQQTPQQNSQPGAAEGEATKLNDPASLTDVNGQAIDPLTGMAVQAEEKESFLMSLLRLVLWAAIIFGAYKLVTTIMQSRKSRVNKKPNYTFGS